MRARQQRKHAISHRQPSPIDASAIVFAMRRHGVGFEFSAGGTLRLRNMGGCPGELWNLFLASDQAQLCAAVRSMLAGAPDPLAGPEELKAAA